MIGTVYVMEKKDYQQWLAERLRPHPSRGR